MRARGCTRACMQCRFASWCICHAVTLRLGPGKSRSCSRDTTACEFTPRKSSGEYMYIHNRQQIHDVTDSAESFIGPSIARISYGYRTDVRGMYGGCTARYRTDTVRISYGYHGTPPSGTIRVPLPYLLCRFVRMCGVVYALSPCMAHINRGGRRDGASFNQRAIF